MKFEAILRGVAFRPVEAKAVVNQLTLGHALVLEREASNVFDSNAIKVIDPASGEFIGYVAKEVAAEMAWMLDAGHANVVKVAGFIDGNTPYLEIDVEEPVE